MLLNLAATLAHYKGLLDQAAAEEGAGGADGGAGGGAGSSRLRAQLAAKTGDLADTLRTILCL